MKLLKATGFELRFQLVPYDKHDDVLAEARMRWSPEDQERWERYRRERIEAGRPVLEAQQRRRSRRRGDA